MHWHSAVQIATAHKWIHTALHSMCPLPSIFLDLLVQAFLSLSLLKELDIRYRSVVWYRNRCSHIFLLEALASLNAAVHGGGCGPLAATFSGNVRGMSRNVSEVSIVVSLRRITTRHGMVIM